MPFSVYEACYVIKITLRHTLLLKNAEPVTRYKRPFSSGSREVRQDTINMLVLSALLRVDISGRLQ